MGNPATNKEFIRLLQKDMEEVFYDTYKELPQIKDQFFKIVKSSKAWIEYMGLGDVPDPARFEGLITYQGFSPGYTSKITPLEYAGGVVIERRLLDTDQYDVIETRTKKLSGAANRKMNKIAHEPFIFHDSSAFTFLESEEGVALCSNSHTTKSGTSTASGFDNLSTLALDAVNLETVRIQSRGFMSDISERIDTNFDTIVHGTNSAEVVWEIMNSQGKLDEITNNANFQRGKWKAIELPLLDDYDTNDWFLIDSMAMKESLIWHEGVPLELNQTVDFDTFMQKFISYFVVGWGFRDWRWIIGSSVS
ncbi:hypothetical protein LCGC14_1344770, partial [marine sediment metagenome]